MKIAIVTGASSGMGREMAKQIGDRFGGIREIWVIARRGERLRELESQIPVPLRILPLDLTEREDLERLEQELRREQPKVYILANVAGFGKIAPAEQVPLEDEAGMIDVNCRALCAVTHLVLPYMAEGGRILQFASAAAFLPQPGFVEATGGAPRQILPEKGIAVVHGKGLLGQEDLAPALLLDRLQQLQIGAQPPLVHQKIGGGNVCHAFSPPAPGCR